MQLNNSTSLRTACHSETNPKNNKTVLWWWRRTTSYLLMFPAAQWKNFYKLCGCLYLSDLFDCLKGRSIGCSSEEAHSLNLSNAGCTDSWTVHCRLIRHTEIRRDGVKYHYVPKPADKHSFYFCEELLCVAEPEWARTLQTKTHPNVITHTSEMELLQCVLTWTLAGTIKISK